MWLTLTTEGWCRLQRVRRTEPCLWDHHRDSGLVVGKSEQSLGESGAKKKTKNTEKTEGGGEEEEEDNGGLAMLLTPVIPTRQRLR